MIKLNGHDIEVLKGDTLLLKIGVYKDGEPYVCSEGDSVRFALKEKYSDPECLIKKEIPIDTMILYVSSEEMKQLKVTRGGYVYDIQLTTADGIVDTFISAKLFTTNEVD